MRHSNGITTLILVDTEILIIYFIKFLDNMIHGFILSKLMQSIVTEFNICRFVLFLKTMIIAIAI